MSPCCCPARFPDCVALRRSQKWRLRGPFSLPLYASPGAKPDHGHLHTRSARRHVRFDGRVVCAVLTCYRWPALRCQPQVPWTCTGLNSSAWRVVWVRGRLRYLSVRNSYAKLHGLVPVSSVRLLSHWPNRSLAIGRMKPVALDASTLISPSTRHWGAWGERRYSSYSFTTSALDGGEWSASRPGRALLPGEGPPVPIVQEAGWAPEPVWTQRIEEKSFAPAGDRTSIARSSSP
jgi:hypothetical protein